MAEFELSEGTELWSPSQSFKAKANLTRYLKWLEKNRQLNFDEYEQLWQWSVDDLEGFWESLWQYFEIQSDAPYDTILSQREMPGAKWFQGARVNYARHVFRNMTNLKPALKFQSESTPLCDISWETLHGSVGGIAAWLRDKGVGPGDRVAACIPNIPQAVMAFLACASIGAVWSSCSPDFGTNSVIHRFAQIEPKVLFAVDGYRYGGRVFDCRQAIETIGSQLPGLEHVVLIPSENLGSCSVSGITVTPWDTLIQKAVPLVYEPLPFDHPLWVVYSSGTTGLPKGLVHSQGGAMIELMKFLAFHVNVDPEDTFFWFSTTGWVMWNILQGSLLLGTTPLLFDGNPGYPDIEVLWKMAEAADVTVFGTSPAFVGACMNQGLYPNRKYDLKKIKGVGLTGSPMPPEGFAWLYEAIHPDIHVGSTSGGTDVASGFLGACALRPVRAGELQCRCLGVKAEAWDESGTPLVGEVGELVIQAPMPSMPIYMWNDPENKKYIQSYFSMYQGVWRHGDWVRITPEGSAYVEGRSDSTLNRQGVRMGSSDIYRAVEDLPEVLDSLVVGFEAAGGAYHMPLFVVLNQGLILDKALKEKICHNIRTMLSPRHIPDEIYQVNDIPRTINGKKMEVPVKRILAGWPIEKAVNLDSMVNPESIREMAAFTDRFA